jgi:hypothetical protein
MRRSDVGRIEGNRNMAQAELELPDPIEMTADAGAKPVAEDADNLLAQMAGEEIDRLLAESDGDAAPKPPVEFTAEIPEPESPAPPIAPPAVEATVEPAAKKTAAEDLAKEDLNAVLATATAERDALRDNPKPNSPLGPLAAAVEGNLKNQSPEIDLPPEPWWGLLLRPLIWINSPLDAWPNAVRDAIGKVAVITLLNSVAVIAYVLIFRGHHH